MQALINNHVCVWGHDICPSHEQSDLDPSKILLSRFWPDRDLCVTQGRSSVTSFVGVCVCVWPCLSAGSSWLCDTHVRQMRRPVSQLWPGCPLKARPGGEEVPQMACEVYIHCPLLNRLALMKCLMSGALADIILPGSPAPWLPEKPPSLQPSLPPSHGLCCHPGRLHTGRCPLLITLDSVRSDMQM